MQAARAAHESALLDSARIVLDYLWLRHAAEVERLRTEYRAFVDGLTEALNAHGVPAMPSWREAIDYLAANGSSETCKTPTDLLESGGQDD